MKTIATAAVLMMLSVPAWTDEPAKFEQAKESMVLSGAELDTPLSGRGSFTTYENGASSDLFWVCLVLSGAFGFAYSLTSDG